MGGTRVIAIPTPDRLPVAVRAYASPRSAEKRKKRTRGAGPKPLAPSQWVLIFDTETTTDAAQQLRIGAYQVRNAGTLEEHGLVYDAVGLSAEERSRLFSYAESHGLEVRTAQEFVERIFFPVLLDLEGICVGFNLPFDISRLAIAHAPARGKTMRGGFTFQLSPDKRMPNVQVKHLNNRAALIRFTVGARQTTPRGMRRRGLKVAAQRGHFADLKSLASALLSGSWSLGSLADHLQTEHRKLDVAGHGGPLTPEYLDYAVGDVQVTWECFEKLRQQYESYGLSETPISQIYSEASIGKAYLRQMGVRPWRELQPGFPPRLLGAIMSSYYGGRSEVHIRRQIARALYCDFKSMYPTVCSLMGLWSFVIAQGTEWEDATAETRALLEQVTVADLQRPEGWRELWTLVQVRPDGDLFPVRAKYDGAHYTIGLNYLTSEKPLWYTLADCIASKLLTGKLPKVLRARRFRPVGIQPDLRSVDIAGTPDYRVDPARDDFYRRLIDLRSKVQARKRAARGRDHEAWAAALDAEQNALKITANATSYGIFVELNVSHHDNLRKVKCYGPDSKEFSTWVRSFEESGRYFHPLLATLITGAARLMLALVERLASDNGITWLFCDTDSMALAQPDGMAEEEFVARVEGVRQWFDALNPYETAEPLFKLEEANYRLQDREPTDALEPLYGFAVSDKRYALFNLDAEGRPVLRKASGHGLGHLRPPYEEADAPGSIPNPNAPLHNMGVERWQYDLWYRIALAAVEGHPQQVKLDDLPGFDKPAVTRYAATTPDLLHWFKSYNKVKPYREQVRPFGFLYAFQPQAIREPNGLTEGPEQPLAGLGGRRGRARRRTGTDLPRPVAPYDPDPAIAAEHAFDRLVGRPVGANRLKTYRHGLARYHLQPEAKFWGGNYTDSGVTTRRHVVATSTEHIGKEANRWEEQLYLGEDPEAQIVYGPAPDEPAALRDRVLRACQPFRVRELAEAAGLSVGEASSVLRGRGNPSGETLMKLYRAVPEIEAKHREQAERVSAVLAAVRERCHRKGVRKLASLAGVDPANLAHVLTGRREPSKTMLAKLEGELGGQPAMACLKPFHQPA